MDNARTSNRRRASQSGSILIMGTLAMFVLLGFMGLAFDASYMYYYKRRMQTAADAGAIAAAQQMLKGAVNYQTAAREDASANGFLHGNASINVAVNNPPLLGPRAGDNGYVEVVVTQPQPTWFMRAINFSSSTITARAVAGLADGDACIYALNRQQNPSSNGIFANGNVTGSFACGMYSNSNFNAVGGACINAPSIAYVNEYTNMTGCGNPSVSPTGPVADPMAGMFSLPAGYATCDFNNYKETRLTTVALLPGTYCGGIELGGSVETVTFAPGEYVLYGKGMKITSNATITGFGVTFFNTYPPGQLGQYDGIRITGSGFVALTAPTTGAYKGLLMWQDPTVQPSGSNGTLLGGSADSVYQGIIYFPTTDVEFKGNSTSGQLSNYYVDPSAPAGYEGYTILVSYNLKIAGTSDINNDYRLIGGNPLRVATFVE